MSSGREEEPVTSEPREYGGVEETHPAFGVITVHRGSGSGVALFQSDVLHHDTITLGIHGAVRIRDLNHDWVHSRDTLIEVEVSLAQWGAIVSSVGIGSGVPVTIRRREGEPFVPTLPYQPRIATNLDEVQGSIGKLFARAEETFAAVEDAIEGKKGIRAVRDALRQHHNAIARASANPAFAVESLARAAETVTSQVRSDIEAQVLNATRLVVDGRTAITAPEIAIPAIDTEGTS